MASTGTLDAFCGTATYIITPATPLPSPTAEKPYMLLPPKTIPQASPSCMPSDSTALSFQEALSAAAVFCQLACNQQWTYADTGSIGDAIMAGLGTVNQTGALKSGDGWAGETYPTTQQGKEVLAVSVDVDKSFCPPWNATLGVWFGQKTPFMLEDCVTNYVDIIDACK